MYSSCCVKIIKPFSQHLTGYLFMRIAVLGMPAKKCANFDSPNLSVNCLDDILVVYNNAVRVCVP
jgi:hypothetical protein